MMRNSRPYNSIDPNLSNREFIKSKIKDVQADLASNFMSPAAMSSVEGQEILAYKARLEAELRREREHLDAAYAETERSPLRRNRLTSALKWLKDLLLDIANYAGLYGTATTLYAQAAQKPLHYLVRAIAMPVALGAMAANSIQDMVDTWNNKQLDQRKTRYAAGVATLGLLGVGVAIMLGVGASLIGAFAAPFALPAVLVVMLGVNYYKQAYIQKNTAVKIDELTNLIAEKEKPLRDAVVSLLDPRTSSIKHLLASGTDAEIRQAINHNLTIHRLTYRLHAQVHHYRVQLKRLEVQRDEAKANKIGLGSMILGFGLLTLGILFPPAAAGLAIAGALFFVIGSVVNRRTVPKPIQTHLDNSISDLRTMRAEEDVIDNLCEASLSHTRGLRAAARAVLEGDAIAQRPPALAINSPSSAASIASPMASVASSECQSPVAAAEEAKASRPATPVSSLAREPSPVSQVKEQKSSSAMTFSQLAKGNDEPTRRAICEVLLNAPAQRKNEDRSDQISTDEPEERFSLANESAEVERRIITRRAGMRM